MKKIILSILVLIIVAVAITLIVRKSNRTESDTSAPTTATTAEVGTYRTSSDATVAWQGKRPLMEGYMDSGTLKISSGTVTVSEGSASGKFVFDMSTISAGATGKGSGMEILTNHLKSADFFDIAKYPTATLVVTKATPTTTAYEYIAEGTLQMKGETHPISFPVTMYSDGMDLRAKGVIEVNRTIWNIKYGSGKFFQDLGEKMIDDVFSVSVDLILKK